MTDPTDRDREMAREFFERCAGVGDYTRASVDALSALIARAREEEMERCAELMGRYSPLAGLDLAAAIRGEESPPTRRSGGS